LSLALLILIIVNSASNNTTDNAIFHLPATPDFPIEAENSFVKMLGQDVDLNSGITIIRSSIGLVISGPTPDPNNVSFLVFNHTDEPIMFQNMGFGLKVFWFDQKAGMWNQIMLPHTPYASKQILPAHLEKYSSSITNQWFIFSDDINITPSRELRIFIEGVGTVTNKKYGAFINLALVP
jgi:hypothetical protein